MEFWGSEEEEEELAVPAPVAANGTGAAVSNVVKAEPKPKAKPEEVKPEEDESDEDSAEEDDSDEDDDSEKGIDVDSDDSDDSEEEEETPQKPEPSNKKRASDSASKTPISAKKAKPAAAPPYFNLKYALLQRHQRAKSRLLSVEPPPGVATRPWSQKFIDVNALRSSDEACWGSLFFDSGHVRSGLRPCTLVEHQGADSGPLPGAEPMSPLQRDDDSSSPTKNDFDKVTTFDLKGVTKTRGK